MINTRRKDASLTSEMRKGMSRKRNGELNGSLISATLIGSQNHGMIWACGWGSLCSWLGTSEDWKAKTPTVSAADAILVVPLGVHHCFSLGLCKCLCCRRAPHFCSACSYGKCWAGIAIVLFCSTIAASTSAATACALWLNCKRFSVLHTSLLSIATVPRPKR